MANHPPDDDELVWICVAYFTTKHGKRIYASSKGKKCFPMRVRRRPPPKA